MAKRLISVTVFALGLRFSAKQALLICLMSPFASSADSSLPENTHLIGASALVELYWGNTDCASPCDVQAAQKKAESVAPLLKTVMTKNLVEFDRWANRNLSFWSQARSQVLPVRVFIDPSLPELQTRVLQNGFSRPIIQVAVLSPSKWKAYSQLLKHEFGHYITYALGAPVTFGPYLEAFGDMMAMAFEPRGWKFMPETAADFRNADRPPELLRISSPGGLRDFTLTSNPRFLESYGNPLGIGNSYFNSAMVNSTFYELSPHVNVARFVEAFLELVHAHLNVAMDIDMMETMKQMLKLFRQKHPREFRDKLPWIKQTLSNWGWRDIPVSYALEFTKVETVKDRIQIEISAAKPIPLAPPKPNLSLVIYTNGWPMVEYSVTAESGKEPPDRILSIDGMSGADKAEYEAARKSNLFSYSLHQVPSCDDTDCVCFKNRVKLATRVFYAGSDGVVHKTPLTQAAIELNPGCYTRH